MKIKFAFCFCVFPAMILLNFSTSAQMVTGTWEGKINREKVEVKIIQNGDSLTGTSYYYESPDRYRRYSIKGYFDAESNEVVWWDDQLIEQKPERSAPGKLGLLARADFNCPGDGRMMLDGKAGKPSDANPKLDVHLDKIPSALFSDEWDFVLENYTAGANDPWIIDSVAAIAHTGTPVQAPMQQPVPKPVRQVPVTVYTPTETIKETPTAEPTPANTPTIEEKFTSRKKVFVAEIPLEGDSILLRFYDHGEIDGDSISLFLNDKLIFSHIRLLGTAYNIKLAVKDLDDNNELTMVAENLGSIPPNTSYMIAIVNEKRYEARLESTEGSSAMIRFVKKPEKPGQ